MSYNDYAAKVKVFGIRIKEEFFKLSKPQRIIAIGALVLIAILLLKGVSSKKSADSYVDQDSYQDYSSSYVDYEKSYTTVSSEAVISSEEDIDSEEDELNIYDELQIIFSQLTYDTTPKEIEKQIKKYKLKYSKEKYNGDPNSLVYKIAFDSSVSAQKYADSGDNLEITFNQSDGSFMYAAYENHISSKTGLFYNYGTYWSFNFNEPNNKYSGYYYYTSGGRKNGIVLEYSNGNTTETPYHPCANAKVVLMNCMYK